MGKTNCSSCKKKCSGEVLRVQEKYFHKDCFKCKVCGNSLAKGGFFSKNNDYYCTNDYQKTYGTKCANCNEYVEGEIISTMGKVFHQQCFTCHRCRQPFPSGDTVTYTGRDVFCQKCVQIPIRDSHTPFGDKLSTECAGCDEELREGQALIALDKQWHVWCFKCKTCDIVLHGEYMGKDGVPYCEKDYQKQFGVKCAYCSRFISGKVLQAGDNHHFHPTCARCSKCGDPFGDGEEMYLQGGAIWHPRCGPGPNQNGIVLNGTLPRVTSNGHGSEFDRASSSAISEMQLSMQSQSHSSSLMESLYKPSCSSVSLSKKNYFRATSPGLILREYNKSGNLVEDISRIYTYSYLTEKPAHGYLKKPIEPYDKPPTSPHFHRPTSANSVRSGLSLSKHNSKTGMKVLVDTIRLETPRPKSPHMNNEEPIELAHYPGAKKPEANEEPKIERDDFPAPPYPYTDPERRRHLSENFKGVTESSEGEDEVDEPIVPLDEAEDQKLKKEEKELSKIATGIGKVFLKNVKEREKIRIWKAAHLDPRNASRTPAANKEPPNRLRFECPIGASPSRNSDHGKPFEEEEYERTYSRSSVGRSCSQIPTTYNVVTTLKSTSPKHGYGVMKPMQHATLPLSGRHGGGLVVSSLRQVPKPGYGLTTLRSHTFSSTAGSCSVIPVDYSFSALGDKTHSTDFSSGKSDMSGSLTDVERQITTVEMPASNTYTGGLGQYTNTCTTLVRRSLPNMAHSALINEPAKIYPYHLLQITNYRLPSDVDRCNLERHLSDTEFEAIFQYSRPDFYQLPQWRRNELKRRARLF